MLRVVDAHAHGVALPLVLSQSNRGHSAGARDVDRGVGRAIADQDHLIDERIVRQDAEDLGDRLLFVVRGNDGRNPQALLLESFFDQSRLQPADHTTTVLSAQCSVGDAEVHPGSPSTEH